MNFVCILLLINSSISILDQDIKFEQTILFDQWQEKNNFEFSNPNEYYYRLQIFIKNDQKIKQHNQLDLSWKLGHNKFSALTMQEIQDGYLMQPEFNNKNQIKFQKQKPIQEWDIDSKEKDWSKLNKTVPIRDQQTCGSCYAFVSADVLSSVNSIIYKPQSFPKFLSPQQILDCGQQFNSQQLLGCNGAQDVLEVARFLKLEGTVDEDVNPYQAKETSCQKFSNEKKTFLKNYSYVNEQYENVIKAIERAPVFMKIQANFSLLYYKQGIIDIKSPCGLINDHVVQAIGYDLNAEKPYIKIQNSWGKIWGESGYGKIAMHLKSKTGMCGILNNSVVAYY